jgi:exosortase/archaeosortase family protein
VGAGILAFDPLLWLVRSWYAPGYDGSGGFVFLGVAGLFAWSASSRLAGVRRSTVGLGLTLLVISAAVRLIAQLTAINIVGALTLAVDVYAIATLCGLSQRMRSIAPLWLAVLFCFCLPVEAVLQRVVGFVLQQVSAAGACGLLTMLVDEVSCAGIRILIAGKDVLVDVPCSGSRVLMIALMAFATMAALRRPDWKNAILGAVTAVAAAWFFNTLRIAGLALGIGFDLPVMAAPWHELIGLASIVGAVLIVFDWAGEVPVRGALERSLWERSPDREYFRDNCEAPPIRGLETAPTGVATKRLRLPAALIFAVAAILIVSLEPQPLDVSAPVALPTLPHYVAGFVGKTAPISAVEQAYFTRFGGVAARASYGPYGLLLVRTGSPLRHLHAPDVCLEGAGHDVVYLGADYTGVPSAVYRSQDPDGGLWRVQVSFVSSTGHIATSVSEAVWHWAREPTAVWTMVERISPWQTDSPRHLEWEAGVARAFNLT